MIGLSLETDIKIGFFPISILAIQNDPFYAVPDEERDI
jgi:hypothetical protein